MSGHCGGGGSGRSGTLGQFGVPSGVLSDSVKGGVATDKYQEIFRTHCAVPHTPHLTVQGEVPTIPWKRSTP